MNFPMRSSFSEGNMDSWASINWLEASITIENIPVDVFIWRSRLEISWAWLGFLIAWRWRHDQDLFERVMRTRRAATLIGGFMDCRANSWFLILNSSLSLWRPIIIWGWSPTALWLGSGTIYCLPNEGFTFLSGLIARVLELSFSNS